MSKSRILRIIVQVLQEFSVGICRVILWALNPSVEVASGIILKGRHVPHSPPLAWSWWHCISHEMAIPLHPKSLMHTRWEFCATWCAASLGGSLSNASNPIWGLSHGTCLRMTSYETTQKAQTTSQTPSPWWWSCSPLQRHGFDELTLLEGWEALHIFFKAAVERFIRFMKSM